MNLNRIDFSIVEVPTSLIETEGSRNQTGSLDDFVVRDDMIDFMTRTRKMPMVPEIDVLNGKIIALDCHTYIDCAKSVPSPHIATLVCVTKNHKIKKLPYVISLSVTDVLDSEPTHLLHHLYFESRINTLDVHHVAQSLGIGINNLLHESSNDGRSVLIWKAESAPESSSSARQISGLLQIVNQGMKISSCDGISITYLFSKFE